MAEVVNMPRLGLNEDQSMIGEWFVAEGDAVEVGASLFSIETDKSSMVVYTESSGTVLKRFYDAFDVVRVMTPVCVIGKPDEDVSGIIPIGADASGPDAEKSEAALVAPAADASDAPPVSSEQRGTKGEIFASPRAKKLAHANGIDITVLTPSGAENRVIEADVIDAMKTSFATVESPSATRPSADPMPVSVVDCRIVKMSNMRKVIAKNMLASLQNTAQLTSHMAFNASCLQKYREWYKASPGNEKNITINDMILFITAKTLPAFEYMNAHLLNDDEMAFFSSVHLGCAVDTERGLMVPTIRDAQSMTLSELSTTMRALAAKCREGQIAPEEMSGATFTVSNLGGIGVSGFTPILNPPQVGILGVGSIDWAMQKTDSGILYYPAGHLSLTYDHRAVDGAPSARFLRAVCDNLERFDEFV